MKTIMLICGAVLIGAGPLGAAEPSAQESSESVSIAQLAARPLLRKAADNCAWQISFYYAQDRVKHSADKPVEYDSSPNTYMLPALPRTATLLRTRPLWLVTTVDVKGNKVEQASDGFNEFVNASTLPAAILTPRDVSGERVKFLIDYGHVDFPDMEWISKETFTGIKTIDSRRCMVFSKGEVTVYVDEDSRYPVLWQKGAEMRVFRELPTPTSKLELPPEIAKLSGALKKDREILMRPAPRGG